MKIPTSETFNISSLKICHGRNFYAARKKKVWLEFLMQDKNFMNELRLCAKYFNRGKNK